MKNQEESRIKKKIKEGVIPQRPKAEVDNTL